MSRYGFFLKNKKQKKTNITKSINKNKSLVTISTKLCREVLLLFFLCKSIFQQMQAYIVVVTILLSTHIDKVEEKKTVCKSSELKVKHTHLPASIGKMYLWIVINFFLSHLFPSALPFKRCHILSKFTAQSKRCCNKMKMEKHSIDPVDRNQTLSIFSIFDCAVQTHAWDNKVDVIFMYTSNLSRMFLISWTNDMLSAYNPFILSHRANERTCRIQMNASQEYGSHLSRPYFDRFSIIWFK